MLGLNHPKGWLQAGRRPGLAINAGWHGWQVPRCCPGNWDLVRWLNHQVVGAKGHATDPFSKTLLETTFNIFQWEMDRVESENPQALKEASNKHPQQSKTDSNHLAMMEKTPPRKPDFWFVWTPFFYSANSHLHLAFMFFMNSIYQVVTTTLGVAKTGTNPWVG